MNILHVVDLISQQTAGGSAKVPFELAKFQTRLGNNVTIYTSDYEAETQQAPRGVRLVKFPCWLNLLGGVRLTPSMLWADFSQFDIIHLHNYRTFVNLVAATRGVPYVLQAHGSCTPITSFTKPIHNLVWRGMIFNRARRYIADAPTEIDQYLGEGADRQRIVWIPVGVDIDEYRHLPTRQPNEHKTILYLGRLDYLKGPDLLVRAVALLNRQDVRLAVAGIDYGYARNLDLLVGQLGIGDRIRYLGVLSPKAKLQAYVDADVYVMPSRYEMWGLTFMEALACGTPVIMTEQCGAASLLPKECGSVVPFDEGRLAEAVNTILDDNYAARYRRLRQDWVRQFDWKSITRTVLQLYKEVLGREWLNRW